MLKTLERYCIDRPQKVDLSKFDPAARVVSTPARGAAKTAKAKDKERVAKLAADLAEAQDRFFALRKDKLLLILQGMDTSGKDGTIRAVFQSVDPIGVRAVSYRAPTDPEKDRDFLWRHHRDVPGRGEIVIFNRSQYEAVLIEYVHGWIDKAERKRRLKHIVAFEQMLVDTGTTILKFFLHISHEEQRRRLQDRIDDPQKNWKFNPQDVEERNLWSAYQQAYEAALGETGSKHAPWYIVPADVKQHRNLMVCEVLLETLNELAPSYPPENPALKGMVVP